MCFNAFEFSTRIVAVVRFETCRRVDANAQVEEFLAELYHGKPKACDLARFMEKMKALSVDEGGEEASRVTLDSIRSAMAQLKKEVWESKYSTRTRPCLCTTSFRSL